MTKQDRDTAAAAMETIFRRLPILWWQAVLPTAAGEAEVQRMVSEKQQAWMDGLLAAQMQMGREVMRFWLSPFMPYNARAGTQRVVDAAAAPARRTVKANAKRLRNT